MTWSRLLLVAWSRLLLLAYSRQLTKIWLFTPSFPLYSRLSLFSTPFTPMLTRQPDHASLPYFLITPLPLLYLCSRLHPFTPLILFHSHSRPSFSFLPIHAYSIHDTSYVHPPPFCPFTSPPSLFFSHSRPFFLLFLLTSLPSFSIHDPSSFSLSTFSFLSLITCAHSFKLNIIMPILLLLTFFLYI